MITKMNLDQCRLQNISDIKVEELKDISTIPINRDKPILERIMSFMEQVGNPYLFKVGETPVKVCFSSDAPTIQKSLENFFTKNV